MFIAILMSLVVFVVVFVNGLCLLYNTFVYKYFYISMVFITSLYNKFL